MKGRLYSVDNEQNQWWHLYFGLAKSSLGFSSGKHNIIAKTFISVSHKVIFRGTESTPSNNNTIYFSLNVENYKSA